MYPPLMVGGGEGAWDDRGVFSVCNHNPQVSVIPSYTRKMTISQRKREGEYKDENVMGYKRNGKGEYMIKQVIR